MDEFTTQPTTFIELDGTSLKSALDIARNYGSVTDDVLSFEPPTLYAGEAQAFYVLAAERKIARYVSSRPRPDDLATMARNARPGPDAARLR